MNRRSFLAIASVAALLPLSAIAGETVAYTPGLIETALGEGKTVLVDYAADWCGTCKRQERVMTKLRAEEPAYDAHILFVRVDWDDYGRAKVSTSRNIPRRSTLLLLKNDQELGRIVAGTGVEEIRALLDKALAPPA